MIRATTGGVLRSYRKNLMSSFISSNKARETVLSQRIFNSYAEDPAAAAKTFRLRKSRMMTSSQLDTCEGVYSKYQSAFASLQTVGELIDTQNPSSDAATLKDTTLRMLNDPEGDARAQLSKALDNLGDTIIQQMNQTYGDEFIFAGADGNNVPFKVEEVNGSKKLFYRGVPVDAAVPNVASTGGTPIEIDPNTGLAKAGGGCYAKVDTSALIKRADFDNIVINDPTATQPKILKLDDALGTPQRFNEKGEVDPNGEYYLNLDKAEMMSVEDYDTAVSDAAKLEYLMGEKRFVDIGLGLQEDENGKLIESSAFNECLNGLTFLGCGLDEDGDPKNIYSIVQRLKEIADGVPEEGLWAGNVYEEFRGLVLKLEDAASEYKTQFTNQSAGTEKLKNNIELLEENIYNLKEQYSNLEDVNMADAISSFIWAEYCYNAALKVGNSILSQSLMDYLQ